MISIVTRAAFHFSRCFCPGSLVLIHTWNCRFNLLVGCKLRSFSCG